MQVKMNGANSKLKELKKLGQSIWLDNLTRKDTNSGKLSSMIQNDNLLGVTSNPAIFYNAISSYDGYKKDIRSLSSQGLLAEQIYEMLVIQDIQQACDLFLPIFQQNQMHDGYVSLEVSPHLAFDTTETIQEAKRLYHLVNRPNCLIKVPATKEGIKAIEELIFQGININVTLIFSVQMYQKVAESYLKGLERRLEASLPINSCHSVASFFLSRIDSKIDPLLKNTPKSKELMGEVAIANAKKAYQSFENILNSTRWKNLTDEGAYPQRLLWASTSTKNPSYDDIMYVSPLIGPYTVNTLPNDTLEAYMDHGNPSKSTIHDDLDTYLEKLNQLGKIGINIEDVCKILLQEGVEKFIEPYEKLLELINSII